MKNHTKHTKYGVVQTVGNDLDAPLCWRFQKTRRIRPALGQHSTTVLDAGQMLGQRLADVLCLYESGLFGRITQVYNGYIHILGRVM